MNNRGTRATPTSNRTSCSFRVSRRHLLGTAAVTVVGTGGFTTRTLASRAGGDSLGDQVWVETDVDTDGDGTNDRIYVSVRRPESTADGEQVPVIVTATPYNGEHDHGDTTDGMLYDRERELSASGENGGARVESEAVGRSGAPAEMTHRPQTNLSHPGVLAKRYVSEGYAVANVSSLGTHESTGCYTAAGPETAEALRAVVDWFNGRATAYDAKRGGDPVMAEWTNGKTGMIGTSANGELANAVATTGVDGLEAIVPIAANNGQYSLFRSNGTPISVVPERSDKIADLSSWIEASNLQRPNCDGWVDRVAQHQDHVTGDYNDFWHDREFLPQADDVQAAVLLTHTVDDPIVKPNNFADWYEALDDADVPLRLWLHKGGHTTPDSRAWRNLVDRWWAYWLKGVENGVMDEDPVSVVHGGDSADYGTLDTYGSWPAPNAEPTAVRLEPDGRTVGGLTVDDPAGSTTESFLDDATEVPATLVNAAESAHRLRYQTPPLGAPVHVSGTVVPNLTMSFDDPTVVSVALVEYGTTAEIVARGWTDPLNRPRYGEHDSPVAYKQSLRESRPIPEGEPVRIEFPLQATDHVFEAGSRLGLVVYGSDAEFTLHPPGGSTVSVSLADSEVLLPVAGGATALTEAFEEEASDQTTTETSSRTETATTERPPSGGDQTRVGTRTEESQGETPGFGMGSLAAALGTAGYLLRRNLREEGSDSGD